MFSTGLSLSMKSCEIFCQKNEKMLIQRQQQSPRIQIQVAKMMSLGKKTRIGTFVSKVTIFIEFLFCFILVIKSKGNINQHLNHYKLNTSEHSYAAFLNLCHRSSINIIIHSNRIKSKNYLIILIDPETAFERTQQNRTSIGSST